LVNLRLGREGRSYAAITGPADEEHACRQRERLKFRRKSYGARPPGVVVERVNLWPGLHEQVWWQRPCQRFARDSASGVTACIDTNVRLRGWLGCAKSAGPWMSRVFRRQARRTKPTKAKTPSRRTSRSSSICCSTACSSCRRRSG